MCLTCDFTSDNFVSVSVDAEASVDAESVTDNEAVVIFECVFLSDSDVDSEKKIIWNYFQTLQRVIYNKN